MKNFPNKLNLVIVLILSTVVSSMSSNYSQTGTSATFYNEGVFTFVNSGSFTTDNNDKLQNSGTISFKGADNVFDGTNPWGTSAQRVDGLVTYSGTLTQNIQNRYFTDLNMEQGGTKDFPDNVFVSGTYTAAGGTRNYSANSGTFTYDGSNLQQIAAENGGTNSYNHLFFDGTGTKRLENGGTAQASGSITMMSTNTGGVTVRGTLIGDGDFTQVNSAGEFFIDGTDGNASASFGAGVVTLDDNVQLNNNTNEARFIVGSGGTTIATNGVVTVNSGTFTVEAGNLSIATGSSNSLSLADDANAAISVGASNSFTVNQGGFVNARSIGSRTNMYFDDASTVVYSDGGKAVITDLTNQYGNLTFDGSGTTTAETDANQIYMSGNLTVNDANVEMNYGSAGLSNTLTMTDEDATATYGTGFEVVGLMKRSIASTSKTLTMNNAATTVDFSAVSGLSEVAFDVRPRGGTDKAITGFSDYDVARDIDRSIKLHYTTTGDFDANVAYGYTNGANGTYDESGTFTNSFKEKLRFREDNGDNTSGKVATSNAITRNISSSPFETVYLTGIKRSGDNSATSGALATVENGGLLFLRGGPTIFISVANGRWSNPATWDEGEQPSETDLAAIRHNVHIGYTKTAGAGGDNFSGSEDVGVTNTASDGLISGIIIDDDFNGLTKTDAATLYVGSNVKVITDTDVASIYPQYDGSIESNSAQTAALSAPTFSTSAAHAVDAGGAYNSAFVVFGGATFILEGKYNNYNSGVYNYGNVTVGQ